MSQVVKVLVQRLRPVVADVPTGEGVHLPPTPPGRRGGAASEASGGNPAELELPSYATDGSAGMDLRAEQGVTIAPLGRALVPTGLAIALPPGYEGQVRPRSGLAWRHGLTVLNAPGTIDSDYRGEVMVLLVNLGSEPVVLTRGERIAQLVVAPVVRAELELVSAVDGTARGAGGFGHTGKA